MKIILSPQAALNTPCPIISVKGLTITIGGTDYDLSAIPEGGQAEAAEGGPFIGTVTREQVTIRYPYDMEKAEDDQSCDWGDYTFDISEGEVPCPIKWKPEPTEEAKA